MDVNIIGDLDLTGKNVFLRSDLDFDPHEPNELRMRVALDAIEKCLSMGVLSIFVAGHRGRRENSLSQSLRGLAPILEKSLGKTVYFVEDVMNKRTITLKKEKAVYLLENLRKWEGEEDNDPSFADQILTLTGATVYINESFAVSHREHASVSALPKALQSKSKSKCCATGPRFELEIKNLDKLKNDVSRPFVVVLGGAKEDKADYIEPLTQIADKVLVGGRLPDLLGIEQVSVRDEKLGQKVIYADLNQDKFDITLYSIEVFSKYITDAKTIFVAGPMGKFEEQGQHMGTQKILEAIADSQAFKVAGGGDSEIAIKKFDLQDKFDWISVGGGASLEYVTKPTLPGLKALTVKV